MTDSEALDERGISLGPKSTEDVLCDHSSDSWIHNLSFVMILGGWVGGNQMPGQDTGTENSAFGV